MSKDIREEKERAEARVEAKLERDERLQGEEWDIWDDMRKAGKLKK